jgi:hypothetical protein
MNTSSYVYMQHSGAHHSKCTRNLLGAAPSMCIHQAKQLPTTIRCNFKCASIRVAFQRRCVVNEAAGRSASSPGFESARSAEGGRTLTSLTASKVKASSAKRVSKRLTQTLTRPVILLLVRALGAAGRPATRSTMHATMPIDQQVQPPHFSLALFFAADRKLGRELSSGGVYVCKCAPARICIFVYIFGGEARGGHLFSLSIAVHISGGRLAESHLPARTKNPRTAAIKLVLGYSYKVLCVCG